MKRYRPYNNQCQCCGDPLPDTDTPDNLLTCPKCGTVYDLAEGKINNTDTMINVCDCKHRKRLFVASSRWMGDGDSGSYDVTVCADCGTFHVSGWKNGQSFVLSFDLVTAEQVTAAGKYVRLLDAESKGEWKLGEGKQP